MSFLKMIFATRSVRHKGAGVPSGRLMEVRAVILFFAALAVAMGGWAWMKRAESYSYVTPKIEQISTAAGKN